MATNEQKCLRLCLMLEGTSLLARDWDDIKATYIIPLLQGVAKAYQQRAECAVVVYRTRSGCNSQDVVQQLSWTSDFTRLLTWMGSFEPRGGASMEVAFAEGLAEALYLFTRPSRYGDRCFLLCSVGLTMHHQQLGCSRTTQQAFACGSRWQRPSPANPLARPIRMQVCGALPIATRS